ncbi:MAG: ABC transporter ATP-binding protein [Myxococcota bacterium]|nr:ABC transporter ATP-binding protein [Myxococcota bacterium]
MSGTIIVEGLSKRFPRLHADRPMTIQEVFQRGARRLRTIDYTWALRDVSFRIGPGRMVGILGFNGAGKSTLLRLVAGVGRPTRGRVRVSGRVGAILELGVGFHPELTGRENIYVAGVTNGLTRQEVADRFDSIVAFAELDDAVIDQSLRTYSTGMHLRLAFAVSSHIDPEVLLIDEVLAVGDLRFQKKCFDRILHFREQGCTGMIATHAPELVLQLCDEAIWLHEGNVAAHGTAEEVVHRYLVASGMAEEGNAVTDPTPEA